MGSRALNFRGVWGFGNLLLEIQDLSLRNLEDKDVGFRVKDV